MVSTSMNVGQFRKMCNSARYSPPAFEDYDSAHREYWRSFHRPPPIYGADISGSLFDKVLTLKLDLFKFPTVLKI